MSLGAKRGKQAAGAAADDENIAVDEDAVEIGYRHHHGRGLFFTDGCTSTIPSGQKISQLKQVMQCSRNLIIGRSLVCVRPGDLGCDRLPLHVDHIGWTDQIADAAAGTLLNIDLFDHITLVATCAAPPNWNKVRASVAVLTVAVHKHSSSSIPSQRKGEHGAHRQADDPLNSHIRFFHSGKQRQFGARQAQARQAQSGQAQAGRTQARLGPARQLGHRNLAAWAADRHFSQARLGTRYPVDAGCRRKPASSHRFKRGYRPCRHARRLWRLSERCAPADHRGGGDRRGRFLVRQS